MGQEVTIRRAESVDDYHACQEAQRRAWGITDDGYLVPVATMVGAQLHGGLVLGAFLPGGQAVGLSFAFLGKLDGQLCLYSQLTGVVPEYQGKGLGLELKQVQWEYARTEGLALLAWAFDPLQAGNARFNLEKLGATVGRYIVNMYGLRTDALNAGVPTDRLIAEWTITPRPVQGIDPEAARNLSRLFESRIRADGLPTVSGGLEEPVASRVLLEIPEHIQTLRQQDRSLAQSWGKAVRAGFQTAFAQGYRAVGFIRVQEDSRRCCYYLLARSEETGRVS